jgi:hypothetical protein
MTNRSRSIYDRTFAAGFFRLGEITLGSIGGKFALFMEGTWLMSQRETQRGGHDLFAEYASLCRAPWPTVDQKGRAARRTGSRATLGVTSMLKLILVVAAASPRLRRDGGRQAGPDLSMRPISPEQKGFDPAVLKAQIFGSRFSPG